MDFRPVSTDIWRFERADDDKVNLLTTPPDALGLLEEITRQANTALSNAKITIRWEILSTNDAHRVWAKIPVQSFCFNKFFNGRYGYRAQFYQAPETGNAYNRCVVNKLEGVLLEHFRRSERTLDEVDMDEQVIQCGLLIERNTFKKSLLGRESKVWLPSGSFDGLSDGYLDIQRWRRGGKLKGVKIPLPRDPYIDFKGTFLSDQTKEEIENKPLAPRSCQIYETGYT